MQELFERILSQYGFGVLISLILCGFFWLVLKWLLNHVDKLVNVIVKYEDVIKELIKSINKYKEVADDAHKYQKEEHRKMLELLRK